MSDFNSLIEKAIFRLRKKKIVLNALGSSATSRCVGDVLLYYKTDAIFSKRLRNSYKHTNDSEVIEFIKVLHELGYRVDLVDRAASWEDVQALLDKKYIMYIANAAGNSAPLHVKISRAIDAACKVYYAAGPEPGKSNELVHKRHAEFEERTGSKCVRRRVLREANFEERLDNMDAVFYVGSDFSASTFRTVCSLPLFRIRPSTSPSLHLDVSSLRKKSPKCFLYFGGNGLICKGLDLVLESFDGLSNLSLDVCGPGNEADFWDYYQPLLLRNPQIKFHGFVDVNGSLFERLTAKAGFNIFPSCSEGCATSVVTTMRRGLIPVVTRESGVDLGRFGFSLEDISVRNIRNVVNSLSSMPQDELYRRTLDSYAASGEYSLDSFRRSITDAILNVLYIKGVI